jgi:hypothetical protein
MLSLHPNGVIWFRRSVGTPSVILSTTLTHHLTTRHASKLPPPPGAQPTHPPPHLDGRDEALLALEQLDERAVHPGDAVVAADAPHGRKPALDVARHGALQLLLLAAHLRLQLLQRRLLVALRLPMRAPCSSVSLHCQLLGRVCPCSATALRRGAAVVLCPRPALIWSHPRALPACAL